MGSQELTAYTAALPVKSKVWKGIYLKIIIGHFDQLLFNNFVDLSSPSLKNDRKGGLWQSEISKFRAEYVQRPVCCVNVQSSLHENVVFSVCARMENAA